MKRTIIVCLALIIILAGCGSNPAVQAPSTTSEQTDTAEPTSVTTEDKNPPEPALTTSVEPMVTTAAETSTEQITEPEVTTAVETTAKTEKHPEVTTTVITTPATEQTTVTTTIPEAVTTPAVETTVKINSSATTMPIPTPETEVTVTGISWVEGQVHRKEDVKAGATVIKADGTKVILTETKVGNLTILGYGQGVDPYSGIPLANGTLAKEGTASWYDYSVWVKDDITGSMFSSAEWSEIRRATFPGQVKGSYEGEGRNTYWQWSNEMYEWLWIGPRFGN